MRPYLIKNNLIGFTSISEMPVLLLPYLFSCFHSKYCLRVISVFTSRVGTYTYSTIE